MIHRLKRGDYWVWWKVSLHAIMTIRSRILDIKWIWQIIRTRRQFLKQRMNYGMSKSTWEATLVRWEIDNRCNGGPRTSMHCELQLGKLDCLTSQILPRAFKTANIYYIHGKERLCGFLKFAFESRSYISDLPYITNFNL